MTKHNRRQFVAALAAAPLAVTAFPAAAQGTPLRVILPVGAGSGVDTIVRAAQNALSKQLGGRPVVIDNLPGAGGITGTMQLVRAAPDGNTIAFVSNNHVVNPSVFKKMPFDSLNDITPITVVGETPFVLVVNPSRLPVRNAQELAAALKAKPGAYNFASSGNGTILHLAAEMFLESAGAKARHIPYKGVGNMITDLISGQVDFGVLAVPAVQGHLKAGTLRAVGITGGQRVATLPDLPTLQEQGFKGVNVGGWFAAIGPKGLPASDVTRLHDVIVAAWNTPEVKAAMAKQDNQIHPSTPEQAMAFFRSEEARYASIVQKAEITVD